MDNPELGAARHALSLYEAKSAADVRLKTIDEHNSAFRWLLGSLFALNGGAAIALIGNQKISNSAILQAEVAFLAGILMCFTMAILGQLSDRGMIVKSHEWGLYWTTVSVTLQRNADQEAEITAAIVKAEMTGRKARLAGVAAMLCFVVGCILVGISFVR